MHSAATWAGRRFHFVGIGGSGMSGLATICKVLGADVSGSDRAGGPRLDPLRSLGIGVYDGHAADNVPEGVELVYSSAVKPENPERVRARELGLREVRRGELLSELAGLRRCVAVAGTHGKTTTAAMIAHALRDAAPGTGHVIGASLRDGTPSASWGAGEWLVVETDESDRTFLALEPDIAVVTNIAFEHMNEYPTFAELAEAFRAFIAGSHQVVLGNQPELSALGANGAGHVSEAHDVRLGPDGSRFAWRGHDVRLAVPGLHNALNAAAALEACRLTGVGTAEAAASLATFPGAHRRLEPVGSTPAGARVYDDYAHHANEIRAALAALRTIEPGRVVAVFESVLYSRTRLMAPALADALLDADAVVVLDVFAASERGEHHPGVSGRLIADVARRRASGRPVAWTPTAPEARAYLEAMLGPGDACLVMGCGPEPQRLARELVAAG